jgi:hypothetical protein
LIASEFVNLLGWCADRLHVSEVTAKEGPLFLACNFKAKPQWMVPQANCVGSMLCVSSHDRV